MSYTERQSALAQSIGRASLKAGDLDKAFATFENLSYTEDDSILYHYRMKDGMIEVEFEYQPYASNEKIDVSVLNNNSALASMVIFFERLTGKDLDWESELELISYIVDYLEATFGSWRQLKLLALEEVIRS
jgi:hypothetical protein